jgi:hypothetical protein
VLSFAGENAHLKTITVNVPTVLGELRTEIHFAEKDLTVAKRAEEIIKTDLIKAVNYFQHIPKDVIHFNIDPYLRVTNGNASVFPTNTINLYNFPASNLEHLITLEDWLQGLIFHEFIHVVHLDQTNGYLETGRNIFGTIAKVPTGIVPRWFTEGVAVWGESHFLQGGRLQNDLLNKDLWIQFNNNKFCQTIDCLDEPGVYPHGQLAYWAGGHFINFLENKKPNTVRCLVFENSSEIPFFLNDSFLRCTGSTAQFLFQEFREEYLKKHSDENLLKMNSENFWGPKDFQKGDVKIGDILIQVERRKSKLALVRYDLKEKINSYRIFSEPIDHIGEIVKLDDDSTGFLVAFNEDPQFLTNNKTWKIINPDTLLEEKTLIFDHDPSYVIPLENNNFLSFTYEENHWRAYRNKKLLREWPLRYNIVSVIKTADHLVLSINTANIGTSAYITDLNLEKFELNGVAVEFKDTETTTISEVETYPKPYHLKPHYWFLAAGTSSSPNSYGAMTSINDPMGVHTLSVSGLLYPSVSKIGGETQYTYTDHLWKSYFLLARDYVTNTWSNYLNTTTDATLGTLYLFELKKWIYAPQLEVGRSSTSEAVSSKNSTNWVVIQSLNYRAMSTNDFWQIFLVNVEWGGNSQTDGDPYYKLQSKIDVTSNFSEDLSLNLKLSFGKLFKNDFSNGVLYGGGISLPQKTRRYEFYGLPYGDAFGNQITTSRMTLDYNLWNIYHGKNLIPFYSKELHVFGGGESLSADRIFIDNIFYKDQTLNSTFIGLNLKTNLFYYVPTDIKFISSQTTTPTGKKISFLNILLNVAI